VGHAVRATYLACGMADVCAETGDATLLPALDGLWQSAFERKAFVTGGLGAHWAGEAFGAEYVLPNERAYAETCAAIGGLMWNYRTLLRTGDARYADWMETALYNGALSGLSLDGKTYFYQNPLADRGGHRRQEWFGTACCPPNIARLLMALPGYVASVSDDGALWLHLYIAGNVRTALPGGGTLAVRVETDYPWGGLVRLVVEEAPDGGVPLRLRVPAWCERVTLSVNGRTAGEPASGTHLSAPDRVRRGDEVELALPMPVRRIRSHPRVLANTGRIALARGPLVYCVEGADHPGVDVWDLEVPAGAQLTSRRAPELLGGMMVVEGEVAVRDAPAGDAPLYAAGDEVVDCGRCPPYPEARARATRLTAIPYHAWANRQPGPMQVWLRERR